MKERSTRILKDLTVMRNYYLCHSFEVALKKKMKLAKWRKQGKHLLAIPLFRQAQNTAKSKL